MASSVLATGELSRRVRLLVGDSGAAEATLGLDCVVKSSLIVLPECFRFSAPGLADIGVGGEQQGCGAVEGYCRGMAEV